MRAATAKELSKGNSTFVEDRRVTKAEAKKIFGKKLKPFDERKKRKVKKLPTERELVNTLLRQIKINTPFPVYIFVDRDSGQVRNTKSGWDFLISAKGLTFFCEAKIENAPLRPFQALTKREIDFAGSSFFTVRFKDVKSLTDCVVSVTYPDAWGEYAKVFRMASASFSMFSKPA